MDKLRIDRVIVTEGRYDKIKLSSLLDATIVTTDGFAIFRDRERQALIRRYAETVGILTATDSDGAGLVIRNFLCGIVPKGSIEHVLIPPTPGKERRKSAPSKEGTLGVEGIDADILRRLFAPYASSCDAPARPPNGRCRASVSAPPPVSDPIDRADFYADGLMGGANSSERRLELLKILNLPKNLSTGALIDAINRLGGRALYESALSAIVDQSPDPR